MESRELLQINRRPYLPITTCPNCMKVWLAPGLNDGDTHECRGCGLSFIVDKPNENTPEPVEELRTQTSMASH